jgi:isoleucyl-tRNA synthetase
MIPATDEQRKHIEAVKDLIMNEVNVKELRFVEGAGILVKKVKCNFRTMGKKFGKLMKGVAAQMDALTQEQIAELEANGTIAINVEGNDLTVELADVEIISEDIPGWLVTNEGSLTVALDIVITKELRQEGIARELVNRIQNIRKESGLEITDRIKVEMTFVDKTEEALQTWGDYVKAQVLADSLNSIEGFADGTEVEIDEYQEGAEVKVNEIKLNIKITKS